MGIEQIVCSCAKKVTEPEAELFCSSIVLTHKYFQLGSISRLVNHVQNLLVYAIVHVGLSYSIATTV